MAVLNTKNPEEVAQFKEALKAASASQLYQIIRDLTIRLPAAIPIISDHLLVTEDEVTVERDYNDLGTGLGSASNSKSTDAGKGTSVGHEHDSPPISV
jgi:hypothetical protein